MRFLTNTEFVGGGAPTLPNSIGERLLAVNGDVNALRPYEGKDGRSYITMIVNGRPQKVLINNAATLRKDEWVRMDSAVIRAARQRLRLWADMRSANTYGGFNGMATMILEHETMSDGGEAYTDFDGLTEGRRDQPVFNMEGTPLPITHSGFWYPTRQLLISRERGQPLSTHSAEQAGRRVAERIEQTAIGTVAGLQLSPKNVAEYVRTPKIYGLTNYPNRITKTDITAPTAGGWTPAQLIADILDMIESLNTSGFYGPFMMYHSTDWSVFLDQDYSNAKGDNTLRDRVRKLEQISDVRRLDYLTNTFTILLVQMTPDVVEAVNGMELTTIQWESKGGMRVDFRVMAIQVPRLYSDYYGNCGICHGTTS